MGKRVSARPSTQVEGGQYDDFDCEITGLAAELFGYPDKSGEDTKDPVPGLMLRYQMEGSDQERAQFYSAGGRVAPSEDGEYFEVADDSSVTGLTKGSNAGRLLDSLVRAGFDENKLDEGFGNVAGTRCHMALAEPIKVRGKEQRPILLVTKILDGGSAAGGSKAKAGGSKPLSNVDEKCEDIIARVLAKTDRCPKIKLIQVAGKAYAAEPNVSEIINRLNQDAFLKKQTAWVFDGRSVAKKAGGEDDIDVT